MTTDRAPVFFLCDCEPCERRYAVLTEPQTQYQLWFDRRYYPNHPLARVAGDGYHCPLCDARLSGGPGLLMASGGWLLVGGATAGALN